MRRASLALVTALAVVACATAAPAQAPVMPAGNYGGGQIPDPPKSPYDAGAMTISLRALGDGKLQIRSLIGQRCETVAVQPRATVAADGTFAVSDTVRIRLRGGGRLRTTYTIQGTITPAGANGTASAQNRITRAGRSRTCKSGLVNWGAARATGAVGIPGAPVAGARLYGNTSQLFGTRRAAIVLRISADGKKLMRALWDLRLRCGSQNASNVFDSPHRDLTIGADGRVKDVEHYTFVLSGGRRVRTTERFTATIGDTGATGTLSSTDRLTDRKTGRKLPGACRSGTVKWVASR